MCISGAEKHTISSKPINRWLISHVCVLHVELSINFLPSTKWFTHATSIHRQICFVWNTLMENGFLPRDMLHPVDSGIMCVGKQGSCQERSWRVGYKMPKMFQAMVSSIMCKRTLGYNTPDMYIPNIANNDQKLIFFVSDITVV